jgi:hypothetical protein
MIIGIKFKEIKVENNLICDGHHRYLASCLAQCAIEQTASISTSLAIDWKSIDFDEEDWDTEAKIRVLNEQDANYNDIPMEKLVELLN